MHPHITIKGDPHDRHPACRAVARYCHEAQRRGGVDVVCVDDVHVRGNEDADGAEAEDGGCDDGGPY